MSETGSAKHIEVNPDSLDSRALFNVMTGSIVPRPIAWVSTISRRGIYNLAPFSMFTAVCAKPPTVVFCPNYQMLEEEDFSALSTAAFAVEKDTYRNIARSGEFVINFVNEDMALAMESTAENVPPEVDEFVLAGVTAAPCKLVSPPRVQESPIAFECKLHDLITIGLVDGGGHLVVGTVVNMHFQPGVFDERKHIQYEGYRPLGGLVGHRYAHISDLVDIVRASAQADG